MIKTVKAAFRSLAKNLVEKTFDIRIYQKRPFGIQPLEAIGDLRSWSAGDVLFDVGANDGRTALHLHQRFPSPSIYAFEPVSSVFENLVRRTKHLSNVHSFQCALGKEVGEGVIHLHGRSSTMHSFSPPWEPVGSESVLITTIDQIVSEQEIDFIHFLKIDTEGYELEVLEGAEQTLTSSRIAIIQLEVGFDPDTWPYTRFELVRQYLAPLGYALHGFFEQHQKPAFAPAVWDQEAREKYCPTVVNRCEAIFIAASLS